MSLNDAFPDLQQFCGSLTRYQHPSWRHIHLTPGALFVAEQMKAWWLMDMVANCQIDPKIGGADWQRWRLERVSDEDDKDAVLICTDGDLVEILRQDVFTDFPRPGIELLFLNSTILLSMER